MSRRPGAFLATLIAFFIAEIGDKPQIATLALAAAYPNLLIAGSTCGMLLANAPVSFLGAAFADHLPLKHCSAPGLSYSWRWATYSSCEGCTDCCRQSLVAPFPVVASSIHRRGRTATLRLPGCSATRREPRIERIWYEHSLALFASEYVGRGRSWLRGAAHYRCGPERRLLGCDFGTTMVVSGLYVILAVLVRMRAVRKDTNGAPAQS